MTSPWSDNEDLILNPNTWNAWFARLADALDTNVPIVFMPGDQVRRSDFDRIFDHLTDVARNGRRTRREPG